MKILIVEDSKTQAERLSQILTTAGYETRVAVNGIEALNIINDVIPDLIISDIVMPEMDGYELCKRIRSDSNYQNILFILLTTLSDIEDIVAGLESGADYIINKPYNEIDLLKHLRAAITIQKMRSKEKNDNELKILVSGREYIVKSKKSQIADFLISIYETAVQKNRELEEARLELKALNNELEKKVEERTVALRIEMEERKRFEQQFLEAQKLESIGKLTGGIAHDFNNLLLIALGNLEILDASDKLAKKDKQAINQATMALERGSQLTKHLLSFARRQTLYPKVINIPEQLKTIISLLKPALSESITITEVYDKNIWPISVDPIQFENAIMNIAINARDAMKNVGNIHFEVRNVTLESNLIHEQVKPGDYVKISVTDQGSGIKSDVIKHIFEPFYTTKERGSGTGLGLSMVYGFIKQSNGGITVDSVEGKGATFNLYFPRSLEAVATKDEEQPAAEKSALSGHEVILIVEDDPSILKLTSTYIKSLSYNVITASDAKAALAILNSGKHIDLLFTDVIMPGEMNGNQLALKAKEMFPDLKILLTSGYNSDVIMTDELRALKIEHLTKPYKLENLAVRLRKILGVTEGIKGV